MKAQEGQKVYVARPCFGSFPIFGANFFAQAPFWAILMDVIAFGTICACLLLNSLALKLANAVAFCGQDCSRNRQGSLKILAGAAKILIDSPHISERQEFSGVRRSSRMRTTIRRTPPGVLGVL